jgi:transcriptional regulator GlxA family with amidase domain
VSDSAKLIAFLVYPGCNILDLAGPLEVMMELKRVSKGFDIATVGQTVEPMDTDAPLQVIPSRVFDEVRDPAVMVVPGGGAPTIRALGNDVLLDYLRHVAESATIVASVCTGALILASAGLLDGRAATTHWEYGEILSRLGAEYQKKRWVQDGKFVTAAGVSAGIDMGLHIVSELTSREVSRKVQVGIEYDPEPPLGGIDWAGIELKSALPAIEKQIKDELAHRPDLLNRLLR